MRCQREKFFLQRKDAYLNCAYMSPLLKKVEKAGVRGMKKKRKPHQISSDDFFGETETVRLLFSKLIENEAYDRVVIIPSVSYGIATVAQNLPFTDGEVIVAAEQFPSNVYPWLRLEDRGFKITSIGPSSSGGRAQSWNNNLLEAISENTRVVAIGHIHWSDGTLFDLKQIRKRLDDVGGLLIIDGTQSIGALPFSVKLYRPDAVVVGGYKWLMGPYSIGLAYYGEAFDQGKPLEENWINRSGSENFARLVDYEDEYRPDALRYEVGEHSNFILIPMLHKALKQLLRWNPSEIQRYCKELTASATSEIQELGYEIEKESMRSHHLFGLKAPKGVSVGEVKASLKTHRVHVGVRGDFIRVSPHVYNDEIDLRKLVNALKAPIFATK